MLWELQEALGAGGCTVFFRRHGEPQDVLGAAGDTELQEALGAAGGGTGCLVSCKTLCELQDTLRCRRHCEEQAALYSPTSARKWVFVFCFYFGMIGIESI